MPGPQGALSVAASSPRALAIPHRSSRRQPHAHRPPQGRRRRHALMCRWLAYSGGPVLLEDALYAPAHSLIDQSLHSRMGAETTNGDGYGIGWYGARPTPAVFRGLEPAWNDANLR